jgi:DNA polymerase-3 subunit gamma/tau
MTKELFARHAPRSFETLLGQVAVVRGLTEQIKDRHQAGHLVLHGPDGAGKLTVARLYAQALQCASPTPAGSPCRACDSCRDLEDGKGFDYTEYMAKRHDDANLVRNLIQKVGKSLVATEWRVIVVDQADVWEAPVFDTLLKILEETPRETVFIFVTADARRLPRAVRSRSQLFPLRPISDELALQHLLKVCDQEKIEYERAALEVIVTKAQGFPGRLLRHLAPISSCGPVTLDAVRERLHLTWYKSMLDYWEAVLAGNESKALAAFSALSDEPGTRLRCMLAFLHLLHLHDIGQSPPNFLPIDPSLLHRSPAARLFIIDELRTRAAARQMKFEDYWLDICRFWLAVDAREEVGLEQDLLAFQQMMN